MQCTTLMLMLMGGCGMVWFEPLSQEPDAPAMDARSLIDAANSDILTPGAGDAQGDVVEAQDAPSDSLTDTPLVVVVDTGPLGPGCAAVTQRGCPAETIIVSPGLDVERVISTSDRENATRGTCGGNDASEYSFLLTSDSSVVVIVELSDTDFDSVVSVRSGGCGGSNGSCASFPGQVRADVSPGAPALIIVEGRSDRCGSATVRFSL